jgi:pentatricopeptide repeat protein
MATSAARRASSCFLNRCHFGVQRFSVNQRRRCLSEAILGTEKSVHENATDRLLKTSTWDALMRQQAKQTIRWWTTSDDNNDDDGISSFSNTWALWTRLAETKDDDDNFVDEKLFHQVLHLWGKQPTTSKSSGSISKDVVSPREMLSLVQEYTSKGILRPTDTTYNIILNALQTTAHLQETPEFADGILEQMISRDDFPNPSMVTFSIVLNIWASSTHPQRIFRVQMLEKKRRDLEMKKKLPDLKPTLIYKSTLINLYARALRPHDCEALWNEWWQDCAQDYFIERPNIQVATTILSGWGTDASRAEAFLRSLIGMHQRGLLEEHPNVFSYTVVLDAWAKSDLRNGAERAEAILRELENQDQLQPNVISYTSVIGAYVKRGNNKKAYALLDEMITAGFEPNTTTFNAIMQGEQELGRARQLLRSMRSLARSQKWDCAPDVVSYTAVMRLCAKRGDSLGTEKVWEEMTKDDIIPDSTAYNNLLNAYAKNKKPVKAQALLEEMVKNSLSTAHETVARPETISFNTVLSAWSDCMNVQKAEALFQTLKDLQPSIGGLQPTVITYTILLNCWSKSNVGEEEVIKRVESLFQEMEENDDIQPNLVSYATLCKCFARYGMGQSALAVASMMRARGIEPTSAVYAQILHALAEQCVRSPEELSALDNIEHVMREMIEIGITPTVPMFSAWLKAIAAMSIPDKGRWANEIVSTMTSFGLQPNDVILRQVKRIKDMNPMA